VEGVKLLQSPDGKKIKFLRRIPLDPMTNTREWGLRSMQDDPKSQSWAGRMFFRFTPRVSRGQAMAHLIPSGEQRSPERGELRRRMATR
jgi:hypothetical protein